MAELSRKQCSTYGSRESEQLDGMVLEVRYCFVKASSATSVTRAR